MHFKINKNKNKYTIVFEESNEHVIKTIINTKLILGATTTNNKTIIFNAKDVEQLNLSKVYDIKSIYKMIYQLGKQIDYLITHEKVCPFNFSHECVYIINNNYIYLPDPSELLTVDNNYIYITFPFTHIKGIKSPELTELKELPITINYKTIYYSLGCFFLFFLLKGKITIEEITNNPKLILDKSYLFGSKIYYFIDRCIEKNPIDRFLIYL